MTDIHVAGTSNNGDGGGYLLGHLLRFGRLLRTMGVDVSLSQMLDLVDALEHVPITDRRDFYYTARTVLINRREDRLVFDQAFAIFWQSMQQLDGAGLGDGLEDDANLKRLRLPAESAGEGELGGEDEEEQEEEFDRIMTYSPRETLREKDFAEMTWEEIQEAKRAIAALEWDLGMRRTRRLRAGHKGRLHLRRVMRDNLAHGGEPINLAYRRRNEKPRPLVVLCDVSGSMERYSRMLLHFIHSLSHGLRDVDVEAFVFGTRLTRITHHLRHRDVDEAMDEIGKVVEDWSGGTRIGESIKRFNFNWARRVLGRGAVLLIISDGWDRGNTELLKREMARLQRSTYRLIWLNPLLGMEEYEPIQRGMAVALPYVDDFLTVHNLESLEQLAEILSDVGRVRPERKQHKRMPARRLEVER